MSASQTNKIAVYLRVSTLEQDTEMQRQDLIRYCAFHNLEPVFFEDKASGSKTTQRPGLKKLLEQARECHFKKVVVWKLDRFARSIRDLLNLIAELDASQVSLVSFKEHLDLSTPLGRMQMQLLGVFAEFELATMKERQRAGIALAKAQGKKRKGPPKKPTVIPRVIEIERSKGYSMPEVARRLKISRSRLYEILKEQR